MTKSIFLNTTSINRGDTTLLHMTFELFV